MGGETKVNFSSPTPVKNEPPRLRSTEGLGELPERHVMLLDFFNRMTTSLRLLKLRKKEANFENISRQVEKLTGRKFLSTHLGQIKSILPEAVVVDTILVRDEKTKCMKQHLKVEIVLDVVKGHKEGSDFLALSDLFSSRLRDFHIEHPEDHDVPEATVPKQLDQECHDISEVSLSKDSPLSSDAETLNPSLQRPTFKKLFDQIPVSSEIKNPFSSEAEIKNPVPSSNLSPPPINPASVVDEVVIKGKSSFIAPPSTAPSTITPSKLASSNANITVATPVQSVPIRPISVLTCEDGSKKATISSQSFEHSTTSSAKKSLKFNHEEEGEEDAADVISREKVSAKRLSGLVISIHKIFQSVDFRPITKEELVHKILMNDFDFDGNSEVETAVGRVEKLVPDWLWKKFATSGDVLYNVKRVSDVKDVCERINAASTLG